MPNKFKNAICTMLHLSMFLHVLSCWIGVDFLVSSCFSHSRWFCPTPCYSHPFARLLENIRFSNPCLHSCLLHFKQLRDLPYLPPGYSDASPKYSQLRRGHVHLRDVFPGDRDRYQGPPFPGNRRSVLTLTGILGAPTIFEEHIRPMGHYNGRPCTIGKNALSQRPGADTYPSSSTACLETTLSCL